MARHLTITVVRPKMRKNLAVAKLAGFINAATLQDFEQAMDQLFEEKRLDVVLDCQDLEYINSTGVSALSNYHQTWRSRGNDLVVIRASKPVHFVLHQLGLTALVPVLKDEDEAIEYLRRSITGQRVYNSPQEFQVKHADRSLYPEAPAAAAPASSAAGDAERQAQVLVIEPRVDLFAEVLKLRYNGGARRFHLVHDCSEALKAFDAIDPDVVILRDTVAGAEEFLQQVKLEKKRSLVSVIKVYPASTDARRFRGFKIWENDYFVEPFDISELFALAELELKRVPRDKGQLLHHAHFQFSSTEEHFGKAKTLVKDLLQKSGLPEDAVVSMQAAFQEAADNAIRHGNRRNPTRMVDVTYLVDPGRIVITVTDEGEGFNYETYLQEIQNEEAYVRARKVHEQGKKGGLGILMMYKCSDRLAYQGAGNTVRLEKKIVPA